MKSKYKVTIEERISEDFHIEADSLEEALKIAEQVYHVGKLVLENGQVTEKQMMGEDLKTGETADWRNF